MSNMKFLSFPFLILTVVLAQGGALESYVQKKDDTFAWKQGDQMKTTGFTATHVELTSQKWRESVWTHNLRIVRPEKVRNPDIAFVFITGDGSGTRYLPLLQTLAERAGAIAAVVTRVPNQPLYNGRKEDALIAYTFDQYLKTGDETWPLLFPMAKSAVKAMDAVQEYARKEHGQKIQRFVTAGASKRGWTTWLSAAVDGRVKGIAPMVIDMLNMRAQVQWADKVYGKQSEQISDYTDLGLIARIDDPQMVKLRDWVDPYAYRNRYRMPKLLLLGTNDRYWTVDSLRHYFDDLPGPKLIFQTPNAGHDLGGAKEATQTLAAFFQMIADKEDLPKVEWEINDGDPAKLSVKVNRDAKSIKLWSATSTDRDFRDDKWSNLDLPVKSGSSRAVAEIDSPEQGYRAFLGEVTLETPSGHPFKLSTEARVTPDTIRK